MIRLNILELLQKQGRTKYWLYKQMGMSYQAFNKMVNNQTQSIQFKNLEALCVILNCAPNELFTYVEEETGQKRTLQELFQEVER